MTTHTFAGLFSTRSEWDGTAHDAYYVACSCGVETWMWVRAWQAILGWLQHCWNVGIGQ